MAFWVAILGWSCLAAALLYISRLGDDNQALRRRAAESARVHMTRSGANRRFGSYNLLSIDEGRHWYETRRSEEGHEIIGPANPELVRVIKLVDAAVESARKGKPLDLSDPAAQEMLEGIGLTVQESD